MMRDINIIDKVIPKGKLTPFAQAMPDEYKDDDVVKAYRSYYKSKQYSKGGKSDTFGQMYLDWWSRRRD